MALVPMATLPRFAQFWEGLTEALQSSLVHKSLHTALASRCALDGNEEEAKELALECGGVEADIPILL